MDASRPQRRLRRRLRRTGFVPSLAKPDDRRAQREVPPAPFHSHTLFQKRKARDGAFVVLAVERVLRGGCSELTGPLQPWIEGLNSDSESEPSKLSELLFLVQERCFDR